MQNRDLINSTIHGAGFHADYVRHRFAERRNGARHVRRVSRGACRPLRKRVGGRAIDVIHAPVDGAIRIQRGAEVAQTRRQVEALRRASIRLLVRSGEDRPFDRIVDQSRVCVPVVSVPFALVVRVDRQPVLPRPQTRHEARQRARRVVGEELRRDVGPVQPDGHVIQRNLLFLFLHVDLDERIPARDHVRAAGEDLDGEIARPF